MTGEHAVKKLIEWVGEDPEREGLKNTPARYLNALSYLCQGYQQDPKKVLSTWFHCEYDEMVVVKDIEFYSLCEHHILPFYGKGNIGYVPRDRVVGLSKLSRLLDVFSRRLQIQERLTVQVASVIEKVLKPKGVMVVLEAKHLCMMCRGVEKQNSSIKTSDIRGVFENAEPRQEFLEMIK